MADDDVSDEFKAIVERDIKAMLEKESGRKVTTHGEWKNGIYISNNIEYGEELPEVRMVPLWPAVALVGLILVVGLIVAKCFWGIWYE